MDPRDWVLVHELDDGVHELGDGAFGRFLVTPEAVSNWRAEPVVVFYRVGTETSGSAIAFWAMQEACPHAGISLA
eukprot:4444657-Prymnesium_polylepis.1